MAKPKGVQMSTPRLSELLENEYLAQRAAEDSTLFERDWQEVNPSECPMCHGQGKRYDLTDTNNKSEPCMNCDATGTDHKMVIGVKSGKPFAYCIEYGIKGKKEFCKAMREAFEELQQAGKVGTKAMMMPYALPKTIEMEFLARGYNVREAQRNGETKMIANLVAQEYPDFLTVPYKRF